MSLLNKLKKEGKVKRVETSMDMVGAYLEKSKSSMSASDVLIKTRASG